ncbi:hypothetical protein JZ751_004330 [Albula glossodonta]|uniref:Uncharacterized protein n=1 Tax=Albula glossodonta TaxID=121402 RepID=A0A8T2ND46_9TELE|nr:hypothetical protein JZ751_004330 [Albula glossodonta]
MQARTDSGESCGATVTVPKETEPMGSMLSLRKEAGKSSEDGEKPTASTSSSGKGLTGHAAKTLPASSSSASSSSSSAGRAKMSVSGPGNKPFQPPSSSSPPPSGAPPPPKIHRARKTMNRPPPTQVRCVESPIVPVQPTEPLTCSALDSDTAAAKRRKMGSELDSTAPPKEKAENSVVAEKEPVKEAAREEEVEPAETGTLGAGPAPERRTWMEDSEEEDVELRLFYNNYAADERGDSDSKVIWRWRDRGEGQ